jgi:hypothetical protein
MKKLLIVILVVLMMAIFVMAALPAFADSTGWGPTGSQGNMTGGGEPGWSYVSKGNGGSEPPQGP